MDHTSPNLSDLHQSIVIDDELAATDQFLRTAIRLVGSMNFLGRDEYVLTAILATGMEKLLKLTLGFIRTDVEGAVWPTQEFRTLGHRIVLLDEHCRALILNHREPISHAGQMHSLARSLDADPYIGPVLELAQDYAIGGRFYNLDYLGAPAEAHRTSPREQWQRLLGSVWEANLDANHWWADRTDFAHLSATNARNKLLQQTLAGWREFYLTAWGLGFCGARAQHLAENITDANPNAD
jgi:hypothetical protein